MMSDLLWSPENQPRVHMLSPASLTSRCGGPRLIITSSAPLGSSVSRNALNAPFTSQNSTTSPRRSSSGSGNEAIMTLAVLRCVGSACQSSSVTNGMNGCRRRRRLSRQKYATSCAAASPARRRSLIDSRYQSQNSFHAKPYAALIES